ncbi:MAG: tetratricopeptide repeat protein [Planctomycetaceae bacterium]
MSFAGWRLLLFAAAGATAIAFLAAYQAPQKDRTSFDRHTGRRIVLVNTPEDAVHEAMLTGNARRALERIRSWIRRAPDLPVLLEAERLLVAELSDPGADEAELDALFERLHPREELIDRLEDALDDRAVADATEKFFAPLAELSPRPREETVPVDETVARRRTDEVGAGQAIAFARAFAAEQRGRARIRWLLRAWRLEPKARDPLLAAFLEYGRLKEAIAINGAAIAERGDDLEAWRSRAQVAAWLSRWDLEAEALERVVALSEDRDVRERLITVYQYTGRADAAVPHALLLAKDSNERDLLERPIRLALEGGRVDLALELLAGYAARGADAAYWRGRIVEYAAQDLRRERVLTELEALARDFPGAGYEERLEGFYRRFDRKAELAALLEARLRAGGGDAALEQQVLALNAALGRDEKVRELVALRVEEGGDPRAFFENLATYRVAGVPGLVDRALALAASEALREEDLAPIVVRLLPLLGDAEYRRVARELAGRFPTHAESRRLRLLLVDLEETPEARAAAAEALAAEFPGDAALLEVWLQRAAWAGLTAMEIRAREASLALRPDDAESRRALCDLYEAERKPRESARHWRILAEAEGPTSVAAQRLVEALFVTGQAEEAMAWLERRADAAETTLEERLSIAETLFGAGQLDRAQRFFEGVLALDPDQPLALLRSGQIHSWSNDPSGAILFLRRRLAVSDEERWHARFLLGEALWAVREEGEARSEHALALEELQAIEPRNAPQDAMLAKMLARLGRAAEARPIYDRLLEQDPRNIELVLDYADAMKSIGRIDEARELLDRAKALEPESARVLRVEGQILTLERRPGEAVPVLRRALELYGPDAGVEADLGRALDLAGAWRESAEAYRRSLALQPASRDVARALQALGDRVASVAQGLMEFRAAGRDRAFRVAAAGSSLLSDERWRVGVALGAAHFQGRADAVGGGGEDVATDVATLQGSIGRRFGRDHWFGGGIELYPGASGDLPLGLWAGLHLEDYEPERDCNITLHLNALWSDPAAAAGLGGRSHGIRLDGRHAFGDHFWAGVDLRLRALSLERPGGGTASDTQLSGQLDLGWRMRDGRIATGDPLRVDALPMEPVGPRLSHAPSDGRNWNVSAWISFQSIRLLDVVELPTLVPIGASFEYVTAAARVETQLARALGARLEAYAGTDLSQGGLLWGIDVGVTYRPSQNLELFFGGAFGQALGRANPDEQAAGARLFLVWRW